jgi:hypothetical protein
MNFLLKALYFCLLYVIDRCCVILIEFCLARLFDCYGLIMMIGRMAAGSGPTRMVPATRTATADC